MKYIAVAVLLVCFVSSVHAGRDRFNSEREDVARTSFTKTQDAFVSMSNVGVIFYGVNVTSPMVNSWINFFSTGNPGPTSSTFTEIHTNTFGFSGGKPKYMPNGISYIKNGNASIEILFDFLGSSVSTRYQ